MTLRQKLICLILPLAWMGGWFGAASASAHHVRMTPQGKVIKRGDHPRAYATHFIAQRDAESRWYYLYQHRCGDGLVWNTCWDRNVQLIAGPKTGEHGWYVDYWFTETTNWLNTRTCSVHGRLKHTTVYGTTEEDCWG